MYREQLGAGQMVYDATTDTLPLSAFTANIVAAAAPTADAAGGGDAIVAEVDE
jgi:hypothetical protein